MALNGDDDPYAEGDRLEGKEDNPQPASNDDDEEDSHSDPEGLTSGSPTPEPMASFLEDAIETAPVAQLQSLLTFICQKNELARQIASSRLLAPLESGAGQKRKAFEKCKNCDEEYNVLQNEKGVCEYHPGEKEPDYDSEFWCDHDEDCHGRIDDLADEPTYEDGFVWSCCEKIGSGRPCVRSRHKPDLWEPVRKKLRY